MADPTICPPEHKSIEDEEIAWVVVTLNRDGMGQVNARSVHLRDEGEAHDVATLLSGYGPTWMLDMAELHKSRYGVEP